MDVGDKDGVDVGITDGDVLVVRMVMTMGYQMVLMTVRNIGDTVGRTDGVVEGSEVGSTVGEYFGYTDGFDEGLDVTQRM